ncbi:tyrosine-protein phosphatase [Mycobacterium sp. E1747]|uniref:tyrosine-protein phosphatase n=1 Tax=Mycobacterium sp. E1747 TaxID=1834128 RepID=UPI0018D3C94E|nr:tyrosine-protein phosphatase [Mycobacterium sp. E1747]
MPADEPRRNECSIVRRPARLDIEGTFNLRDVGDLPVAGGGTIRSHLLYRGDAIDAVTESGADALRRLNLRTVIDLREPAECKRPGPDLGDLVKVTRIQVFRDRFDYGNFHGIDDLYAAILDAAGSDLAAAISVLAQPNALPALVHCTGGKDRTGLVIGLLLAALNVPIDAVASEYALTAVNFVGEARTRGLKRAAEAGVPAQQIAVLLGSPAEAMTHALTHVVNTAGSVAEYLTAHGVTPGQLQRIREELVTPTH